MKRPSRILLGALLSLASGALLGQGIPALSEIFLVNTYSTAGQFAGNAAVDGSGNFVVVWSSDFGTGSYGEIQGQLFDALGAPIGSEFEVNTYSFASQDSPRVARRANGEFVVVWQGALPSGVTGVSRRRYDISGNPVGNDFVVAGGTSGAYTRPAIAANDNGYLVAWQSSISPNPNEIRAIRYDWAGAPVGSEFTVSSGLHYPDVAMDATGRFAVTWSDGLEVQARVYDSGGSALGPAFQVNTYTTNAQRYPSVAMDDDGSFVVVWQTDAGGGNTSKLRGQRFDAAGDPVGLELELTQGNSDLPSIVHRAPEGFVVAYGTQNVQARRYDDAMNPIGDWFLLNAPGGFHGGPRMAANNGRHIVFTWTSQGLDGGDGNFGVFARRGGFPDWAPFTVDERAASGGSSNVNGVIETGERVVVDPAYRNLSGTAYALAGTATDFTGPAGPTYTIQDSSADYGTISGSAPTPASPSGSTTADCFTASGNCLELQLVGARPAGTPHWDATYTEALTEDVSMTRTLHVGGSFADVPGTNIFFKFIENLFHNSITSGGACGGYCPSDGVKRQQMALFLLKSKYGASYVPPSPTGTVFADVNLSNPFCMWIEDLYNQGITGGCDDDPLLLYCPDGIVNRQQMAVFLLKMKDGALYDPPDCAQRFGDVLCTPGTGFSDWIDELYNRGVTGGCQGPPLPLLYCPASPVLRGQMAAFLVKNFGLVLYGP
jgi:hypothetical protein